MKPENQKTNKSEFSINKVNAVIKKLNKTTLVIIVVLYVCLLGCILGLVGRNSNYIIVEEGLSEYKHVDYDDTITPQISLIGLRTFDDDNNMTLKYSVIANITARYVDGSDPKYVIKSFKMDAATSKTLEDTTVNKMYYFSEYNNYTTSITHTFTMDNSDEALHPTSFYVRLQYEKDNEVLTSRYKEDVWLQPTANDVSGFDTWYGSYADDVTKVLAITGVDDIETGKNTGSVQVIASEKLDSTDKELGIYNAGIRIIVNNKSTVKYHIDMQSWILTKAGSYLPFIGVYNYTSPLSNYTQSNREINKKLNPEYICVKVHYTSIDNDDDGYFYYKQKIESLPTSFTSSPDTGVIDAGDIIKSNRGLYIGLSIGGGVLAACMIVCVVHFVTLKKKKEEN